VKKCFSRSRRGYIDLPYSSRRFSFSRRCSRSPARYPTTAAADAAAAAAAADYDDDVHRRDDDGDASLPSVPTVSVFRAPVASFSRPIAM